MVGILIDPKKCIVAIQSQTKSEIRKAILGVRDAINESIRDAASQQLVKHVDGLALSSDQTVAAFLPIRSEIDLRPLMQVLAERVKRICLPVVINRQTIVFREYLPGSDLVETGFGTSGPGEEAQLVDPDVLLMPLAAFDGVGNRLGYGAGHYDRAIARLQQKGYQPKLVGVAFDCQRVAAIPADAHDVPLHTVLTETGVYELAQ